VPERKLLIPMSPLLHRNPLSALLRTCSPALLLALLPLAAAAQPDDERLPDLTPSVFEIQGELEIDLPQLERQPLSGFGPPPRSYVVPAERQPATRPYGPPFDGLPALALAAPPDPRADLPEGRTFRVEVGAGIEAARYARLDAAGRAGPAILFLSGAYDGVGPTVSFGDEPPDDDGEVRFDRFDVRGGARSTGAIRGGLEGRYARDAYSLPFLGTEFEPERTVSHGAVTGTLDVEGETPAALRLGVARTSADDEGLAGGGGATPAGLRFDGAGHVEVLRRLVRLEGAFGTSSFSSAVGQDGLFDYEAGLVLQAHRPGGAAFALGVRLLGYEVSSDGGAGASTTVFAPVARVEVPVGLSARLFAFTEPGLTQRGFADLLTENPYTVLALLAPDVHTVDAQAGVEVRAGIVGFKAYGGATFSPTRQFFEQSGGLYAPAYDNARVFSVGADVTVATASGVEATAGVAYRDGQLTDFDEAIPFFAATVGRLGLQVPFDRGRGRLGLAAYGEGSRPTTRSPEGRPLADGWATLTAYGAYELAGGVSVVLRGERLLGHAERWPGFPQVPFAVMAGLRFSR